MTWLRVSMLLLGLGLLYWVLQHSDLEQVGTALARLGLLGALAVFFTFLLAFLVDTLSWHLALPSADLNGRWLYRLWKIRTVGEAFNVALPTTLGGEPIKAVLLKRHYGIPFQESGASLVMAKTVNLLALIVFAAFGLGAIPGGEVLPSGYHLVALAGLATLALGSVGFFAVQRWCFASRLAHLLARWRFTRAMEGLLVQIDAVEGHFHRFYVKRRGRFAAALALAFLNWCLGMAEIWLIMGFLGHPVSWGEAWVMAALIELVRAGTFFIPGSLGATELTFVLIVESLTGQASLGLAVGLVRRGRELLWIAWGLLIGWGYSAAPAPPPALAKCRAGKVAPP